MYNVQNILLLVFLTLGIVIAVLVFLFPRQSKNTFYSIFGKYRKRYVICHMKYSSGLEEIFNIIPNLKGLTQVGNYSYMLEEKYALMRWKGRLHFLLDEADSVPKHIEPSSKDDIIYQSAVIQSSIDTSVMDFLFAKKKEILINILIILVIVCILVIIYNIYSIRELGAIIQTTKSIQVVT